MSVSLYEECGLYIGGDWKKGSAAAFPVINPATEEKLGESPAASAQDAEEAVVAARHGYENWRRTDPWKRADILDSVAGLMRSKTEQAARVLTMEIGKPIAQSLREWNSAIDQFVWCAGEARRLHGRTIPSRIAGARVEVVPEPIGIVAAFSPWNFPPLLMARKIAPALAAGCSVICRPSNEAPAIAMLLIQCLHEAGLPEGVVNLLIGETKPIYETLMASPDIRKISFTGSTEVGKIIIRDSAETVKRVTMELGGNAPAIFFDDIALEPALEGAISAKYANSGQVCISPDRFYVHKSILNDFVSGFVARAEKLKLGNGLDPEVQMGPLVNAKRHQASSAIVERAKADGAKILTGGKKPKEHNRGFFFEPTVMTGLDDSAPALCEENFAPIAVITPFQSEEEVWQRANASEHGLAAYLFTHDAARVRRGVEILEAGMIGVNQFALAAADAPFGGIKQSGDGREGGAEAIRDYTRVKLCHSTP